MRYISIDPATKSIAVCCIDLQDKDLNGFDESITSLSKCNVISAFAIDLAPSKLNKNITTLERVKLINTFVENYVVPLIDDNTKIIIEDQIGTTKTYVSFITLLSTLVNHNIIIIKPSKKNQLTIGGNSITDFYKKYTNNYNANKEHARAMFKSFQTMIKKKLIYNKKYETDIADAFVQMIYYIING